MRYMTEGWIPSTGLLVDVDVPTHEMVIGLKLSYDWNLEGKLSVLP